MPHSNALARSEKLIQLIRHEILRAGHAISFAHFMELALYAPALGYYSAETNKFGEKGDFITAPEISPLFAQCVAKQCQQIQHALGTSDILEIGAGSGTFARDLLRDLEKTNSLPGHYFIYEISPELREQQQRLIKQDCPHLFKCITWLDTLPKSFSGIIFANEVLDALPVHCFQISEGGAEECCVTWQDEQFAWHLQPPQSDLATQLNLILTEYALPIGYRSEVNLAASRLIQTLGGILQQGVILLLDYGYGRAEYYHSERQNGTLTCFYQHRQYSNPLILTGLQDITAHVDFTTVAESALTAGLSVAGFTTQAAFLLACGLLDIAAKNTTLSEKEKFQQSQAIKTLTLPSEMGEVIKVMSLTKNVDLPLLGFSLQDRRRNL